MPISDQDMERLAEVAGKATPRPWWIAGKGTIRYADKQTGGWIADVVWRNRQSNAPFIAAANPSTILSLIERVKEAEGKLGLTMAYADTQCFEAQHQSEKAAFFATELDSKQWAARAHAFAEVAARLHGMRSDE